MVYQRSLLCSLSILGPLLFPLMDCDLTMAYLDAILSKRESEEDYIGYVKTIMQKIREYRFKISEDGCKFYLPKIKYLGQLIDKKGRKPDPSKVKASKHMPTSTNVTTLEAFFRTG